MWTLEQILEKANCSQALAYLESCWEMGVDSSNFGWLNKSEFAPHIYKLAHLRSRRTDLHKVRKAIPEK